MDARRQSSLVVGLGAVVSAMWLIFIPWDLSEVDERGNVIAGGGDDVFGSWRAVALAVGWFAGVTGLVAAGLQRRWALRTLVVFGSFWFLWRTGVARVTGANFFLVGWSLFFLPAALAGGLLAAVAGQALRRVFDRTTRAKGAG